jgi:hypothetical protein
MGMKSLDKDDQPKEKKYFYKLCPRCGAKAHIDNDFCVKCGAPMRNPGAREPVYSVDTDPEVSRSNLDYAAGCPACGLGCRYCFSYSTKTPHEKANCAYCERTRKVCCMKARKLPWLTDVIPQLSLTEIFAGKAGNVKIIREEFTGMYMEKVAECWSHCKEASEIKKAAGL